MSNKVYICFSQYRGGDEGEGLFLEKVFYSGDAAETYCVEGEVREPIREYWFEEHEVV